MFNIKARTLLRTTATAAVLIGTMIPARASITIAVAANFTLPLQDLLASWGSLEGYTGTFFSGATATLEQQIISNTATHYDLFLAANTAAPNDLYSNYSTRVINPPFNYAEGGLVLWSGPSKSVNITSGLPYPVTTDLLIAGPSTAPYGFAAYTLLNDSPWSAGFTTSTGPFPGSGNATQGHVYLGGNIGSTYNNLLNNTSNKDYGFIAKSDVCLAATTAPYTASWNTYVTGAVYAYEYYAEGGGSSDANYPATGASTWTTDAAGSHPFGHILQGAIRVNGPAPSAEIESFISFLNGTTYPGVALSIIKKYCYRWAIGQ
ncbi:molybdate ABC transporter substrate-binding protein (plasmid) [Methylosinus sp. C49]|nr:molybdate ABC transporter substrate-binding protein [Methylosinus sp. C49]